MRYLLISCVVGIVCGCAGRASIMPNPDKSLRKTSAEFAADAAKRHPYKIDAPRGGEAVARAEVDYTVKKVDIVNLSDDQWDNVEVWINGNYVVFVPTMESKKIKKLDFQMMFDDQGQSFPTSHLTVSKIEILRDGKMYDVKVRPAD